MFLELSNVAKNYVSPQGQGVAVLRDVNLALAAGQSIAIVGPSGSGKSTLLNIVGGLDRPSAGSVRLDGQDLLSLGDRQLAAVRNRRIGFVFQLHHLLPQCSAAENVLLPTLAGTKEGRQTPQRALDLLERVGLADRATHRPSELSVGQCQRVAVARALVNSPSILLADEPTGSLDHQSSVQIADLLAGLNRDGLAMIVVTHSMELARRMGRVFVLRDGLLAESPDA